MILGAIGQVGIDGGVGYVVEYARRGRHARCPWSSG